MQVPLHQPVGEAPILRLRIVCDVRAHVLSRRPVRSHNTLSHSMPFNWSLHLLDFRRIIVLPSSDCFGPPSVALPFQYLLASVFHYLIAWTFVVSACHISVFLESHLSWHTYITCNLLSWRIQSSLQSCMDTFVSPSSILWRFSSEATNCNHHTPAKAMWPMRRGLGWKKTPAKPSWCATRTSSVAYIEGNMFFICLLLTRARLM